MPYKERNMITHHFVSKTTMPLKLLDRYLYKEMAGPFIGGLLTFSVLITGHMLFLAIETLVERRVPLGGILRYVGYQLPGATIMALPVATLLSVALAMNRLAREQELIAIRAAGASLIRLMLAPFGLGVFAALVSLGLNSEMAPRAQQAASSLMRDVVLQQKALVFKPQQFWDTGRGLHLYVESTDPQQNIVRGVYVFSLRPEGTPLVLWAPEARFGQTALEIPYGRVYVAETDGSFSWMEAEAIEIDLTRLPLLGARGSSQIKDMTMAELWKKAFAAPQSSAEKRSYLLELQARLALAGTCLVFAFFAGPVIWRVGRRQSFVGVLVALLTVFVFFIIMLWLRMLGNSGILGPFWAAWGPNMLFGAAAFILLWRQR